MTDCRRVGRQLASDNGPFGVRRVIRVMSLPFADFLSEKVRALRLRMTGDTYKYGTLSLSTLSDFHLPAVPHLNRYPVLVSLLVLSFLFLGRPLSEIGPKGHFGSPGRLQLLALRMQGPLPLGPPTSLIGQVRQVRGDTLQLVSPTVGLFQPHLSFHLLSFCLQFLSCPDSSNLSA